MVGIVAACGLLPPGVAPGLVDEPLVTLELRGGDCPQGECRFTADIYGDGRVVRSDGEPQVVDEPSLARLAREVEAADWEAVLAVPFEGECPTAYDGQEAVYTFHVAPAPVVIASCTTLVDPAVEPFQSVQGILFGLGG